MNNDFSLNYKPSTVDLSKTSIIVASSRIEGRRRLVIFVVDKKWLDWIDKPDQLTFGQFKSQREGEDQIQQVIEVDCSSGWLFDGMLNNVLLGDLEV